MMATETYTPRLKQRFTDEIRPRLASDLGLNLMAVPRPTKIVVNMGVGEVVDDPKVLDEVLEELAVITGQKPLVTKARKSIAAFKIRQGMDIGAKVTLRGVRMWEFLDRLMSLAIPRIRDFRGFSPRQFDGRGNYTFGMTQQIDFPEIDYDKVSNTRGMDITIVTSADDDEGARAFFDAIGFPFRRDG